MVVCRYTWPGRNVADGKEGWLGESGKHCVSRHSPVRNPYSTPLPLALRLLNTILAGRGSRVNSGGSVLVRNTEVVQLLKISTVTKSESKVFIALLDYGQGTPVNLNMGAFIPVKVSQ